MANRIIALILVSMALFTHGAIAIAQEAAAPVAGYMDAGYIADQGLWDRFVQLAPSWLVAGVPIMIALMIAFRGISEALWIVAKKTQTDVDDKVANVIGKIAEVLARITGAIGVGLPKTQLMAKAEKIATKELASGEADLGATGPKGS